MDIVFRLVQNVGGLVSTMVACTMFPMDRAKTGDAGRSITTIITVAAEDVRGRAGRRAAAAGIKTPDAPRAPPSHWMPRKRRDAMPVRKSQVLLLDDDVTQRLIIVSTLRSQTTEVHAFGDTAEAQRVCSRSAFDLFLVDLGLPGPGGAYDPMAGLNFISSVRKSVSTTRPVVVLTASRKPSVLEPAFRAGADDFVLKDEGIEKVRSRARYWLDGGPYTAEDLAQRRSRVLAALTPPPSDEKRGGDDDFYI